MSEEDKITMENLEEKTYEYVLDWRQRSGSTLTAQMAAEESLRNKKNSVHTDARTYCLKEIFKAMLCGATYALCPSGTPSEFKEELRDGGFTVDNNAAALSFSHKPFPALTIYRGTFVSYQSTRLHHRGGY